MKSAGNYKLSRHQTNATLIATNRRVLAFSIRLFTNNNSKTNTKTTPQTKAVFKFSCTHRDGVKTGNVGTKIRAKLFCVFNVAICAASIATIVMLKEGRRSMCDWGHVLLKSVSCAHAAWRIKTKRIGIARNRVVHILRGGLGMCLWASSKR